MLPVAGTEDTVPLPKRNPLGALSPEFRSKFADLRTAAGDRGAYFDAPEQGSIGNVRSLQQQLALYAQGRSAPGPVVTGTTQSNHITGKALDVVPTNGASEKQIGSVLSALVANDPRFAGMRSGATFSNLYDPLHIELNKPQGNNVPQQSVATALQRPDDGAALPVNAQPTQGQSPLGQQPPQAPPQQMAQAQPQASPQGRVAPPIPPEEYARAREIARKEGPTAGIAALAKYRTPADQWEVVPSPVPGDNNKYQRNSVTNELKPLNPQPFAVNVNNQAESKFSEEAAKHQAKRYDELAGEAPAAKQMQSDVSMLRDLGEKIKTGKLAEVKAVIGPYANAIGIDVKNLDDIQAFEAVVNRVAPQLRVKGTGSQSDFELRNFLKQMPAIGNTPEGNALIDKTMQGFVQNKLSASEIGSLALNGEITRKEADKRLRELPDPMAEWREFNKKTKAAAEAPPPPAGALEEARRRGLIK